MGWRTVVVSKPSKLDLRLGYMVVRDCENTVRVHISEISVLIVENTASSVTTRRSLVARPSGASSLRVWHPRLRGRMGYRARDALCTRPY